MSIRNPHRVYVGPPGLNRVTSKTRERGIWWACGGVESGKRQSRNPSLTRRIGILLGRREVLCWLHLSLLEFVQSWLVLWPVS